LAISRLGGASITWEFEILKAGEIASFGSLTTVRVNQVGEPQIISDQERSALS